MDSTSDAIRAIIRHLDNTILLAANAGGRERLTTREESSRQYKVPELKIMQESGTERVIQNRRGSARVIRAKKRLIRVRR